MTKEQIKNELSGSRKSRILDFVHDIRTHCSGTRTNTYYDYKDDKRCKDGKKIVGQHYYTSNVYSENTFTERKKEIKEFIKNENKSTSKVSWSWALGSIDVLSCLKNPFLRIRGIKAVKRHMNRVYKDIPSEQEYLKYFNSECNKNLRLGLILGIIGRFIYTFKRKYYDYAEEGCPAWIFKKINY